MDGNLDPEIAQLRGNTLKVEILLGGTLKIIPGRISVYLPLLFIK